MGGVNLGVLGGARDPHHFGDRRVANTGKQVDPVLTRRAGMVRNPAAARLLTDGYFLAVSLNHLAVDVFNS